MPIDRSNMKIGTQFAYSINIFSLSVYRQMEQKGLWRYAALNEEGVANSLAKVFAVNGGRREMGVAVRFKEQVERRVDYVNKLYSSTDGGQR